MKNRKMKLLLLVICLVFSVTFYFGVFANPNFDIHEFCMNLTTEILGLVIVVVLIDNYSSERKKARRGDSAGSQPTKP